MHQLIELALGRHASSSRRREQPTQAHLLRLVIVRVAESVVVEHTPRRGRLSLPGPRTHWVIKGVAGHYIRRASRREVFLVGVCPLPHCPEPIYVAVV